MEKFSLKSDNSVLQEWAVFSNSQIRCGYLEKYVVTGYNQPIRGERALTTVSLMLAGHGYSEAVLSNHG